MAQDILPEHELNAHLRPVRAAMRAQDPGGLVIPSDGTIKRVRRALERITVESHVSR